MFRECLAVLSALPALLALAQASRGVCLREMIAGENCCTPTPFLELSFTLRLNTPEGSDCNPPSFLDQGIRLEVRNKKTPNEWKSIRFYASTNVTKVVTFASLLTGNLVRVSAKNYVSTFPLYLNDSREPFRMTEYLCGSMYLSQDIEFRWLQRYSEAARDGIATWSISNVSISSFSTNNMCMLQLEIINSRGRSLSPTCSDLNGDGTETIFFGEASISSDRVARRRMIIKPDWRRRTCSDHSISGCSISDNCRISMLDDLCSVGNLTCQCPPDHIQTGLMCSSGRNECANGTHDCDHICTDTLLSYECSCRDGYQLASNGRTCHAPMVGFVQLNYSSSENEGRVRVCVHLEDALETTNLTLRLQTHSGSAVAPGDYRAVAENIFLSSSVSEACVVVEIEDDLAVESTEYLTVSLSSLLAGQALELDPNSTTIYITDNDVVTLALDVDRSEVMEGGSLVASVEKESSGKLERPITLSLLTVGGTAQDGSDYIGLSTSLILEPEEDKVSIGISTIDDRLLEENETFSVHLMTSDPAVMLISVNRTALIIDNDTAVFGFVQSSYTVGEDNGSVQICVQLKEEQLGAELTMKLQTHRRTAQAPGDYREVAENISLSSSVSEACVVVEIEDDSAVESTEYLTVSLSSLLAGHTLELDPNTTTIYITDNDVVTLALDVDRSEVVEGGSMVASVVKESSGKLERPITLSLFTVEGTALGGSDYTGLFTSLTLEPGEERISVDILTLDDQLLEENETFCVHLMTSDPAVVLSSVNRTALIIDNDVMTLALDIDRNEVVEGGSLVASVVKESSGKLERPITLSLLTVDGTAHGGSDYTGLLTSLTLEPGKENISVDILTLDDQLLEENETFCVHLMTSDPAVVLSSVNRTALIIDNDVVTLALDVDRSEVVEGGSLVASVVKESSGKLERPITLSLFTVEGTANGSSDYNGLSTSLTLEPGEDRMSVNIFTLHDQLLEENETFSVHMMTSDPAVALTSINRTVLIIDNDAAVFGFEQSSYIVDEYNITVQICVQLRDGQLGTELTLKLQTHNGTAQAPGDYRTVAENIYLSSSVSEACVVVEIQDDSAVESTEYLTVSLSSLLAGQALELDPNTTTIYITDNDMVTLALDVDRSEVVEGGSLVASVVKESSGKLERPITLSLLTAEGTAQDGSDYTGLSTSLTLEPGEGSVFVDISTLDDQLLEKNETFFVHLMTFDPTVVFSSVNRAVLIIDNDTVVIGFAQHSYTVSEGHSRLPVCVQLREGKLPLGTEVALQIQAHNGTARALEDYRGVTENISISSSVSEACVVVEIEDDSAVESTEYLTVSLSLLLAGQALELDPSSTTIYIIDNDEAIISLERANGSTMDIGDANTFEVCVRTNSILEKDISLRILIQRGFNSNEVVASEDVQLSAGMNRSCKELPVSKTYGHLMVTLSALEPAVKLLTPTAQFTITRDVCSVSQCSGKCVVVGGHASCTCEGKYTLSNDGISCLSVDEALDEIKNLLTGVVDVGNITTLLENIVNNLVATGQIASLHLTETFLDVVYGLIDYTNKECAECNHMEKTQIITRNKQSGKGSNGSHNNDASALLETLDKFALRAFNASLGEINRDNNIKLQVITPQNREAVIGITGPENNGNIKIPGAVICGAGHDVTVASYYLKNLTGLLSNKLPEVNDTQLVSAVISSTLGCGKESCEPVVNSTEPIHIELHHHSIQDSEEAHCVFWNLESNVWSKKGCSISGRSTPKLTICECNHLTHFAVMLSPKNSVKQKDAYAMQIIGYVGTSISLVCLLMTISVFCFLKQLWSMRNYIHVNLCISLFVAQLIFISGIDKSSNEVACQIIAVLLHYSFLVTFMWMLMEGIVLYVALVKVFVTKQLRYIIGFTVASYGLPLLYMGLTLPLGFLLHSRPHYGGDICWLKSDTHFVWAFIAPVILIILANFSFFVMAIYIIRKQGKKTDSDSRLSRAKHWLKVCISLLLIMGITWIVGVLTFHEALLFVSYIFTIFIAFQGAFIFILFVVASKQVRETLKKWVKQRVSSSDLLSQFFSEKTYTSTLSTSRRSSQYDKKSDYGHNIQLGSFDHTADMSSVAYMETKSPLSVTSLPAPNECTEIEDLNVEKKEPRIMYRVVFQMSQESSASSENCTSAIVSQLNKDAQCNSSINTDNNSGT